MPEPIHPYETLPATVYGERIWYRRQVEGGDEYRLRRFAEAYRLPVSELREIVQLHVDLEAGR